MASGGLDTCPGAHNHQVPRRRQSSSGSAIGRVTRGSPPLDPKTPASVTLPEVCSPESLSMARCCGTSGGLLRMSPASRIRLEFPYPADERRRQDLRVVERRAVAAAVEGGAAYLGFVFYPPSPRSVSPARAAALCAEVPASVRRVGLFVDADDDAIGSRARRGAARSSCSFTAGKAPSGSTRSKARFRPSGHEGDPDCRRRGRAGRLALRGLRRFPAVRRKTAAPRRRAARRQRSCV